MAKHATRIAVWITFMALMLMTSVPVIQATIGWNIETVDSIEGMCVWTAPLALDSFNDPHISYYDETNGNLKYARKISS